MAEPTPTPLTDADLEALDRVTHLRASTEDLAMGPLYEVVERIVAAARADERERVLTEAADDVLAGDPIGNVSYSARAVADYLRSRARAALAQPADTEDRKWRP